MKKQLLYLVMILSINLNSFAFYYSEASCTGPINDGPYIFRFNNKFRVTWIENNKFKEAYIKPENYTEIKNKFNLLFNYKDLTGKYLQKPNYSQSYNRIDSIGVISDVHGQYNIYINLLKAMGIIDNGLNWKFGKGHLVVLGDIFDRGNMVTEVFWHLFGLEKQALEAGGMVHMLLGNHEIMVLGKDLRYINEKYKEVEVISNTRYYDLYSLNSVLGKWLRTKPVMISLNNIIFVHGGISIESVRKNLQITQINKIFSEKIVGKEMQTDNISEEVMFLDGNDGPIWFRGYFTDKNFCESRLDSILDFYSTEHIVVGHTVTSYIKPLFNNRIIGVDAGIMNEQQGEMLIYKNGFFYRGLSTGRRIKL